MPAAPGLGFLSLSVLAMLPMTVMAGTALARDASGVRMGPSTLGELPCHVMPEKPDLGFDSRFHAGYQVGIPLRVLADSISPLNVTITVRPAGTEESRRFLRTFRVPAIPPGSSGEALFGDGLELGPGRFQVMWTIQDASGRVCSSRWEWEAKLGRRQRDFPLTLDEDAVADRDGGSIGETHERVSPANPRRIKVLLNISPSEPWHTILKPEDSDVLLSILRGLAEEPGIFYSSLLAFNLREQRVVYRAENNDAADLASLHDALRGSSTGTVSYSRLQNPLSETHFITRLLAEELGAGAVAPDAIVIIGPKIMLDMKVPIDALKKSGAVSCPIFYFNYNPNPADESFSDTIGSALKAYKAAVAYNITLPNDLGAAVRNILSRIGAPSR